MADLTADYIVVGGGLTGCLIASRLSQSKKKPTVLLLEAGADPSVKKAITGFISALPLQGRSFDWGYHSERVQNTAGRKHMLNAGRALGGGSILNFGGWVRADAADYNEWGHVVGDPRWSYEGLKPWFRKSERWHDFSADPEEHGFDGPMFVTTVSASESGRRTYPLREPLKEAWAELGVPLNMDRKGGSITGLTEMCENSLEGMRQPSYTAYPLHDVTVFTNCLVHRVIFAGQTATGVELANGSKYTARKEVILCAGAYRTPQLLMLSGIGPVSTLAQHSIPIVSASPHVGQNLHDHFAVFLAFRLRYPSLGLAMGSKLGMWKFSIFFKGLPWDWVVSQPLPTKIIAKHESDPQKQKRNMYQVLTLYVSPGIPGIPVDGTHISTSTMLLRPTSRGAVSIRSADPRAHPLIWPNYLATQLDRDTLTYATRQTLKALLASTLTMKYLVQSETPPTGTGLDGLTPLTADSSDEEIEERIRRTGTQHHHSAGTAAMGKVVDAEGKVMGVQGLRIADASIVPLPLGGHPQATLYAMAEQLASMIIESA